MSDIRVLLVETCTSLSQRSTLTFQIGIQAGDEVVMRLVANTGKGYFSKDWVSWPDVQARLTDAESLSCMSLQPLYMGQSINSGGFLLAVLRHMGVVQPNAELGRSYVVADLDALMTRMAPLVSSKVSLGLDAKPVGIRGRRKLVAMPSADAA